MSINRIEDIKVNRNKNKGINKIPLDKVIPNKAIKENDDSKVDKFFNKKRIYQDGLEDINIIVNNSNNKKNNLKTIFTILFFIIVLGGVYFVAGIFEKTDVNIIIKRQKFNLDHEKINISKNVDSPINFEIMIIDDNYVEKKTLTEVSDVSIKAKGQVTLYNSYSKTDQKIVINTFLADENGKNYKTDEAVNIPGYKLDKDGKIVPGQVVVNITAFLPGDVYNGEPSNFYITAFKNTDKYQKIYGKLKTPIKGGALGMVYSLTDKEKADIDNVANTIFRNKLLSKVNSQNYPGYIVYPDASSFAYSINDDSFFVDQKAEIEISGTLSVILLNEKDLSKYLTRTLLPNITDKELEQITTPNLKELTFGFTDINQLITKDIESIAFTLSGNFNIIWNPQIETIKEKIAGVNKNNVTSIFKEDEAIDKASVKIFPPWNSYISSDPSKINITIE